MVKWLLLVAILVPRTAFAWCDELNVGCVNDFSFTPFGDDRNFPPGSSGIENPQDFLAPQVDGKQIRSDVDLLLQSIQPPAGQSGPTCQAVCSDTTLPGTRGDPTLGEVRGTEPVLGDGEFIVDETDLSFPGFGIPFEFKRFYRSGISHQTPLGYGWSHNFQERVVVKRDCGQSAHPDIEVWSNHLERIPFHFRDSSTEDGVAVDHYVSDKSGSLVDYVSGESAPWRLRDGSGITRRFDQTFGTLSSITHPTGHALKVVWDHTTWTQLGGKVAWVVDTTGRKIYFNHKAIAFAHNGVRESLWVLSCLSLTDQCDKPLVSFITNPSPDAQGTRHDTPSEFDLVGVRDGNGDGPTYEYFEGDTGGDTLTHLPSRQVAAFCSDFCGSKSESCTAFDACAVISEKNIQMSCNPIALGFGDPAHSCNSYCAMQCMDGPSDACIIEDASPLFCANLQMFSFCSHAQNVSSFACKHQCFTAGPDNECPQGDKWIHRIGADPEWNRVDQCCVESTDWLGHPDFCAEQAPACVTFYREKASKAHSACVSQCQTDCKKTLTPSKYAYGILHDLRHNLVRVTDGDGRLVLQNDYGTEPTQNDFDRVKTHHQKLGPDTEPMSKTTFTYRDFTVEAAQGTSSFLSNVRSPSDFGSRWICPCEKSHVAPDRETGELITSCDKAGDLDGPVITLNGAGRLQMPAFATVVTDPKGITKVNYYDNAHRLIRAVDSTSGFTQDFNYSNTALIGAMTTGGLRTCIRRGLFDKPEQIATYPAGSYAAQPAPMVEQLQYDGAGLLIAATADPFGAKPSKAIVVRDELERVIGIGQTVSDTFNAWSCFVYGDVPARPPRFSRPVDPPPQDTSRLTRFGCAAALHLIDHAPVARGLYFRQVMPTHVYTVSGAETVLRGMTAAGPTTTIVDSAGKSPLAFYARYDDFGRLVEQGRADAKTGLPIAGSGTHSIFDDGGLLRTKGLQDFDLTHWSSPLTPVWADSILVHDKSHHLQKIVSPTRTRTFTTDPLGRVTTWTDTPPSNDTYGIVPRTTCIERDVEGRPLQVAGPEKSIVRYEYDTNGRPAQISMGFPEKSLGAWASACQVTPQSNAMESVAAFRYDTAGFLVAATAEGVTTTFATDGFGRAIDTSLPQRWLPKAGCGPRGTSYAHLIRGFDRLGRVAWEGLFTESPPTYDKPTAPTATMIAMTEFDFDQLDRVTAKRRWRFAGVPPVADPEGPELTTYVYDDEHGSLTITSANGSVVTFSKDGAGRVTRRSLGTAAAETQAETSVYGDNGDTVTTTISPVPSPAGKLVRTTRFNAAGIPVSITENGVVVLRREVEVLGRRVKTILPGGNEATTLYDAFGRPRLMREVPAPGVAIETAIGFDGNDRATAFTDGNGNTTHFTYDALGRTFTTTDGIGVTTRGYETGSSRISSLKDAAGTLSTIVYDAAGRVSKETVKDGPGLPGAGTSSARDFLYDARGLLTHASSGSRVVAASYDSLGRRIQEHDSALPFSVAHAYSQGHDIVTVTHASTSVAQIDTSLDAHERPTSISFGGKSLASVGYVGGQVLGVKGGNGISQAFIYDQRDRAVGSKVTHDSVSIASIEDVFGEDSVPRQRLRTFGQRSYLDYFKIDRSGRLFFENLRNPQQPLDYGIVDNSQVPPCDGGQPCSTITLDKAGNWNAREGSGAFTTIPDGANRYTKVGKDTIVYDAAGAIANDGENAYRFDGRGQLQRVSTRAGDERFAYDPLGRLSSEAGSQSNLRTLWDGGRRVATWDQGAPEKIRFEVGAKGIGTLALVDDQAIAYLHSGPDGSILAATGADGSLTEGYAYSGFGEPAFFNGAGLPSQGSVIGNRTLFQGARYDQATKLYAMGVRHYKPSWGRFISPDPIGLAGGPNLYAFVGNRPLSFIDPSGLSAMSVRLALGQADLAWQLERFESSHPQLQIPRVFHEHWLRVTEMVLDEDSPLAARAGGVLVSTALLFFQAAEFYLDPLVEMAAEMPTNFAREELIQTTLGGYGLRMVTYGPGGTEITGSLSLHQGIFQLLQVSTLAGMFTDAPEGALFANGSKKGSGAMIGTKVSALEEHLGQTDIKLSKQLASEAVSAEVLAGNSSQIAGAGMKRQIDDLPRLIAEYGGSPADWVKITSRKIGFVDGSAIQTHAYQNITTGAIVELKTKLLMWSP